jgi:hypothetical protein
MLFVRSVITVNSKSSLPVTVSNLTIYCYSEFLQERAPVRLQKMTPNFDIEVRWGGGARDEECKQSIVF